MLFTLAKSRLLDGVVSLLESTLSTLASEVAPRLVGPLSKRAMMGVSPLKAGLSNRIKCGNDPINNVDPEGLVPLVLAPAVAPAILSTAEATIGAGLLAAPIVWAAGDSLGEALSGLSSGSTGGILAPRCMGSDNDFRDGALLNFFSKSNKKEKTDRAEIPMDRPGNNVAKPKRDVSTAEKALDQQKDLQDNIDNPHTPHIEGGGKTKNDATYKTKQDFIFKDRK